MRYDQGYGTGGRGRQGRAGSAYDAGYRRPSRDGYGRGLQGGSRGIRARRPEEEDLWWLGNAGYDRSYVRGPHAEEWRAFDRAARPRYSPVGGMHSAMGSGPPPAPLRYDRWFSEWTRWF
jgi:hypothetical protein